MKHFFWRNNEHNLSTVISQREEKSRMEKREILILSLISKLFFSSQNKPTIFILEKTLKLLKMMCSGQNMKTSFRRGHLAGPDVIGQRLYFQKHLLLQGGFFRAMICDQESFLPLHGSSKELTYDQMHERIE